MCIQCDLLDWFCNIILPLKATCNYLFLICAVSVILTFVTCVRNWLKIVSIRMSKLVFYRIIKDSWIKSD